MDYMKRTLNFLIFALLIGAYSYGQDPMSKADALFYEFSFQEAIAQYKKEMVKSPLTNNQFLNLADSYFNTDNYKGASDTYFEVFKKDSTMSSYHFNRMLQAMTKTSGLERAKALFATRSSGMSSELMENAEFNFQMLSGEIEEIKDFQIFNISGNSPQADFSPTFYKDRVLFTSGRGNDSRNIYEPTGESYLDVFIANIDSDGDIRNPNPFTGLPDTEYHQATPYYSEELGNIFFINSNEQEGELVFDEYGKNSLALGRSNEQGLLQFLLKDLSTSFYYPFYDIDSGNLYFAANFKDSYGGTDLYYVRTNNGQIMSAPVNLGPRINTPGNDIAPYIFEGSLYYASDIFYGLGGMDIYKSEVQEGDEFSIPINLGEGINSASDDFGLIIKNDEQGGLVGYMASDRPGGKGRDDIYGFKMAKEPGLKTFAVKGIISNSASNVGISKARIQLRDSTGNVIKEAYSADDGKYRIEIPWQHPLSMTVEKNKYSTFSATYSEQAMDSVQLGSYHISIMSLDDLVEEKENQTVVDINKFYFSRGSTRLPAESIPELDKVVEVMTKFPQLQLRVEAHTDSRGSGATNFRLSQGRADAMKEYLISKGVEASSILYSIGYGEDKILNHCTNGVYCLEVLHKQNERYLFVILNYNLLD